MAVSIECQSPSIKYQITVQPLSYLTANDVKSAQCDEGEDVEFVVFDHCMMQLIHQDATLLVKHMQKVLEDFEVKRRC